MTLDSVPFRLQQIVDSARALFAQRAVEKGLGLEFEIDDALAQRDFQGDPLRLGQVLINLLGNAIKFSERGEVRVGLTLTEDAGDVVVLRCIVSDQGIGIAAADQPRLFHAFEQADDSLTRRYGGTGLGLAISKRLVGLMGGEIGVDSRPGEGSVFWFTVRLLALAPLTGSSAPVAAETEAAEQRLAREHAGARILLAEDEPVGAEVIRTLLEDVGLHVEHAEDGARAVHLARAAAYDLILMDMQMPHMNGLEATREIRAMSRNRTTPIIALTANAFEQDRDACLEAGMNEHLVKPLAPEILYATLLRHLASPDASA